MISYNLALELTEFLCLGLHICTLLLNDNSAIVFSEININIPLYIFEPDIFLYLRIKVCTCGGIILYIIDTFEALKVVNFRRSIYFVFLLETFIRKYFRLQRKLEH